jgi:hypothetical protein
MLLAHLHYRKLPKLLPGKDGPSLAENARRLVKAGWPKAHAKQAVLSMAGYRAAEKPAIPSVSPSSVNPLKPWPPRDSRARTMRTH